MTQAAREQLLFGDLVVEDTHVPPLDGSDDCSCQHCQSKADKERLLAVTACDGYEREIDLDPTANDPLPDLDSDRKVA